MTIIQLQRRVAEIGRLRIGEQVATSNGKTRPAKLSTWRATSADRKRIEYIAKLYGGEPREWQAPAGKQWEVITETDALPVIVPPSAMAFSQFMELWSAGGCQRRCDGVHESISDRPCLCDPDAPQCSIHTRLSVMLRDVPGLGVYRLDTSGWYAASELSAAVEVIQTAAGRGAMLPARLLLEQRTVKRQGSQGKPETRRFAVPVLDIEITPAQLMGGAYEITTAEQTAAIVGVNGDGVKQLLASTPPENEDAGPVFQPVPRNLPTGPRQSIAEQSKAPPPKKRRSNSAPEIPRSGRQRSGMATMGEGEHDASMQPSAAERTDPEGPPSKAQNGKLHAMFSNDLKIDERQDRLALTCEVLGTEITSWSDLKFRDAHRLIDEIESWDAPADKAQELLNMRTLREAEQSVSYPESEIN